MAKRRRHGVVEAPTLEELISPVQQAKKRRLEEKSPGAWSVEEVTHYLSRAGLDESVAKAFRGTTRHCVCVYLVCVCRSLY